MLKKTFFKFCKVLNREDLELYSLISKKIEQQPYKTSMVDIWKLSQQNLVDAQIWLKIEQQFSKWLNHIDTDDLARFSILIQKHQQYLSQKTKLQFENRIRKLSKNLTTKQIPVLIEKIFPLVTEQAKQQFIQLTISSQNITLANQMKCLLIILENSKTMPYQIIEKAKQIAQISEFSNYDEIIVYLQLFYSNVIKDWIDVVSKREETKLKLNEIIYGYKTDVLQMKITDGLNFMKLSEIMMQINKLQKDESFEFKRFLTLIQYLRACKFKGISVTDKSEIESLFIKNYNKLTPYEIIQMFSELDQIVDKKIQIKSLKDYIAQNQQYVNNNYLIMFQTANLKHLQSMELSEVFLSNFQFTLERLDISILATVKTLLQKTSDTFPKLSDMIENKMQLITELTLKSINIHSSIKLNCALQITRHFKLENATLQNLWERVQIDNLEQIQQVLIILRNEVNKHKLNGEQMSLIQNELRNQFQIVTK